MHSHRFIALVFLSVAPPTVKARVMKGGCFDGKLIRSLRSYIMVLCISPKSSAATRVFSSLSLFLKPGAPRTVPLVLLLLPQSLLPPPPRDPPPQRCCNSGTGGDDVDDGQGRSKGDDIDEDGGGGGGAGSPGLRRFSRPRSSRTISTAGCPRRRPGCFAPRTP